MLERISSACDKALSKKSNLISTLNLMKKQQYFNNKTKQPDQFPEELKDSNYSTEIAQQWIVYASETPCQQPPVVYWKSKETELKKLFGMFTYYWSIPASSASVESTFSVLRKVQTDARGSMGDDYLSDEMFLRCNSSLVRDFCDELLNKSTD